MSLSEQQKVFTNAFMQLQQPPDKVQCMHVWIDGSLRNFRSKDKTLPKKPNHVEELPEMEFCGSATDFDVGNLADYYSRPVKFYKDPFRGGNNTIVYCETYCREGLPTFANNRFRLLAAAKKYFSEVHQFTFYQPYSLFRHEGHPITYLEPAYTTDSKCGFVGGREVSEAHYRACLYAGVNLTSYEPISRHAQWRYSIGPGSAIDVADDTWISRIILVRVAEEFGVVVKFGSITTYSCLTAIDARLSLAADNLDKRIKQRIVDFLLSKFVIKEGEPLKITSLSDSIRIANLCSEIDPYALFIKVMEALSPQLI